MSKVKAISFKFQSDSINPDTYDFYTRIIPIFKFQSDSINPEKEAHPSYETTGFKFQSDSINPVDELWLVAVVCDPLNSNLILLIRVWSQRKMSVLTASLNSNLILLIR